MLETDGGAESCLGDYLGLEMTSLCCRSIQAGKQPGGSPWQKQTPLGSLGGSPDLQNPQAATKRGLAGQN